MRSALTCLVFASSLAFLPGAAAGQQHLSQADIEAMAAHMKLTPKRGANSADSLRAENLVGELRESIAKYRDVSVAVKDGFRQFAPELKEQRVYHFTNYGWALRNAFRFDSRRPTSLLYEKDAAGKFVLVGAMYTAPRRFTLEQLDRRVPLSVAQWHKHVNWCLPPRRNDPSGWLERRNGRPVFGPLGVSTRAECEAAGGRFMPEVFGWMVHASVFAGDDPRVIWGDDHGMSGEEMLDHRH